MPDHDDENNPLTSSKKFSSIRFRRLSISSKRKSELKATISGPRAFDGSGMSTIPLGGAPLRALNSTRLPHPNSAIAVTNEPPSSQQTVVKGLRRNSDIPLRRYHSNLAWPTNHPGISPVHGSPHHLHHTAYKKPRKADISRPLASDSSRFSSVPGISRKFSRRSVQINRGPRLSVSTPSGLRNGNQDQAASQELSPSNNRLRVSNLPDSPSDEFDPRTMMGSYPTLDLDLNTSAASFGSVKQRTRVIDKALRASRTTLFSVPQENAKPDLVYTDDSDAFTSPPSTPSTPAWETTTTSLMPKTDPKSANKLDLADVHAQIQAMIDSTNRPPSTGSGDLLAQAQEPPNTHRTDIPPSLRPSNPVNRLFPRFATTHRRTVSSPPLGSDAHQAYPPDFNRPVTSAIRDNSAPPTSPLSKTAPAGPTSTTPADLVTPTTPTKKSFSEQSDSPSVYSQQSPSSQTDDTTTTSSNASSPDHPHAKDKHERLLAAISAGISSPTKLGPTTPSTLGSGRRRDDNLASAGSFLHANVPAVPVIVVTDPNDDDLVYSESSFSIIDMYAGSAESGEAGQRRRTRTANSVSHVGVHPFIVF